MLPSPVLCSFLSSVQFGITLTVNTNRQSLHFAKTARLQSLSDRESRQTSCRKKS